MTQRYEVKGKIGHGGLGEVYLAYDTRLDREVAVKRVRPQDESEAGASSLATDLLREAKTLSSLQHPNIVTIYDVGRDDNGPFVIMELLKGETLDQVIDRGKLSTEDFQEVVLQTMEGMVAAQALGLVHRDLKPGNLMVIHLASGKFQVKILDFGLAKFSKLAVPQTEDQEKGIFGSIFFMAPEQFERLPLDARTDMYSLGCIFYQVLAQKHPFDGRTPVDVMVSHLQHLVTPLHELRSDIPPWMADWVMWLISREMDDRPANARDALEFFHAKKSGLPSAAPLPAAPAAPVVKVVGRGTAPGRPTQAIGTGTHARPVKGSQTQPVRGGTTTQQMRGGTHSSAVSSRPAAKRVSKKGGANWVSMLTGIFVLGGCAGIIWYVYKSGTKPKEDPRAVLTALKGESPEGSPEDVQRLVKLAGKGGDDARDVLVILKKLRGQGVADTVAMELEKAEGPLRDLLIEAAGTQPSKAGATTLTNIALNEKGEIRGRALAALGSSGEPASVPELMKLAPKFPEDAERKVFYKTVGNILTKEKDREARVKLLAPALKGSDAPGRLAILRLLGSTGSPMANDVLAAEIAAGGERSRGALEVLPSWSGVDAAIADAVFTAARSGDHDVLTGTYCRVITRISSMTGAEVVAGLKKALPLAETPKARLEFVDALGTLGSPEALAFATELAAGSNAALAEAVKPAVESITQYKTRAKTLTPGENTLEGSDAVVIAGSGDAFFNKEMHYLAGWRSPRSRFAWDIVVPAGMTLEVEVMQSSALKDRSYFLHIGPDFSESDVVQTKTTDDFIRVKAGKFTLTRPGNWRVWLEAGRMPENEALVNVKSVSVKVN